VKLPLGIRVVDVFFRPFRTELELFFEAINLHGCVNGVVMNFGKLPMVSLEGRLSLAGSLTQRPQSVLYLTTKLRDPI
jgi:hypothetical protein